MAEISIKGNLGSDPEKKTVKVDGEDRDLAEFRFKSTEGYTDKVTKEWVDQGAWYSVVVWAEQMRESVLKHLKKGNSVIIVGKQTTDNWIDKETGERQSLNLRASVVSPWLPGVSSLTFEERKSPATASAAAAEAATATA